MKSDAVSRYPDRWFWIVVVATFALVLAAAVRDPVLGAALAAFFGLCALLLTIVGTRRGTLLLGALLLVVDLVLPGDLALRFRIPIGGGGIYILDMILALLIVSVVLVAMSEGRIRVVESPLRLPILLFLGWTMVAAVIGYESGNDVKLILQDLRSLVYYAVFFFAVMLLADRRDILLFLRVLATCMVLAFTVGALYAASGRGGAIEYVESGVSRFPASDVIFLMGAVLITAFIVVWPAGRRRPVWLWLLLLLALIGLVLSFVRGNWVAFAAGLLYLLAVIHVRERMRLIAGGLVVAIVLGAGLAVADPAVFSSVVTRALAVTAVNDPNVQYRLTENREVWRQIADEPIFGNGLGTQYLFDWSRYGVTPFLKSYIHNNYYWFLQRLGAVGLLLFIWMAVAFLGPWMRGRTLLPRDDPWISGLVFGGRAVFVALLVNSITSPRFNSMDSVAVLALIMGMSEVALAMLRRRAAEEQEALVAGGAAETAQASDADVGGDGAGAQAALSPLPPVTR
jgi:O-antigen ligase